MDTNTVNVLGPDYLDDATLERMTDRAYWSAARAWGEAVAARRDKDLRAILTASAESASAYHQTLKAEQDRRAGSFRTRAYDHGRCTQTTCYAPLSPGNCPERG